MKLQPRRTRPPEKQDRNTPGLTLTQTCLQPIFRVDAQIPVEPSTSITLKFQGKKELRC